MSSVRQHPIYFVLDFFLICAFAPVTEGMVAFLLKFRNRIPYINRHLQFILRLD